MAVGITSSAGRAEPGAARTLFRNVGLKPPTTWRSNVFEVSADGRFLANVYIGEAEASPIVLQTGAER